MGSTEAQILASLGITDPSLQSSIIAGNTKLLILDSSAHMDWDWLLPFPVLVNGGTEQRAKWYFGENGGSAQAILAQAGQLLAQASYRYSVCETGFLRGYAAADPAGFQTLLRNGVSNGSLRFTGGGITSPDNLVSHGEAFIRTYLLGHLWLAANCPGVPTPVTAWLPDDFGHDPELPVVLQAMGMVAAGFQRIPGFTPDQAWYPQVDGSYSLAQSMIYTDQVIDFTWKASDGSSVAAHWLVGSYHQGAGVSNAGQIDTYLDLNLDISPTPYIYVPVLNDFSLPDTDLTGVINTWNGPNMGGTSYCGTLVVAAAGSFEDYGQLLGFHASELDASFGVEFPANPYWTGFYATRPALKQRHQVAARTLLAAEAFSIIAGWAQPDGGSATFGAGSSAAAALQEAWELLAPSTHHDFVTGTSIPDVYHTEQVRMLDQAVSTAQGLLRDAMDTIAGSIDASWSSSGVAPVAVFNALGWERSGVVELSAAVVAEVNFDHYAPSVHQELEDGGILFWASAPSLGYSTVDPSAAPLPFHLAVCETQVGKVTGNEVHLTNGLIHVTLSPDGNGIWGLTSVTDGHSGAELIAPGQVANDLLFFADGGDEYQLGAEIDSATWTQVDVSEWLSQPEAVVLEQGPFRATVRTTVRYDDGTSVIDFVRDYTLQADEPFLRMRTSGAAPMLAAGSNHGSSVLVSFPLAAPISSVAHGTACHWTQVQPDIYWNGPTFLPTHDWVIPRDADGNAMAAVYHAGVHAWGLNHHWNGSSFDPNDGILYGCLWRNGDGHYFNWTTPTPPPWRLGTDPGTHVLEYALRLPTGLGAPASGAPLREARAFTTPLLARPVAPWTGSLPETASLVSSSDERAMVTVVKPGSVSPGDVVFRVYQPTLAPLEVTLTVNAALVAGGAAAARGQTALEQDVDPATAGAMNVQLTQDTLTFTAPTALSTIALTPSQGAPASSGQSF